MSKTRNPEATREEIVQKKDGFVLYKRRCKLVQHFLNNEELGELFRGLIDYVHNINPTFSTKEIEAYYNIMVDDVEEMNEKYVSESRRRAKWYADQKKKSQQNQNSDDENGKNVKDVKDVKNAEDVKNRIDIDKDIAVGEGTAQGEGTASASAQIQNTLTNISNSKKEYNTNNLIFLNNPDLVKKTLEEKNIFFKDAESFNQFFEYNNDTCHWCLKPQTASQRWFKKNPDHKLEVVKKSSSNKKEAPQPPATPARLKEARDKIWQAIRDQVPAIDFKNWLQPLQLVNITPTTDGDNITLGTKSKFHAEMFAKDNQHIFRQTYFALTSKKVNALECVFVDGNEIKTMQILTALESAALRKAAAEAQAAEAQAAEEASKKRQAAREKSLGNIRANLNPGPNVYAQPAPAEPEPEPEKPETPDELFARVVRLTEDYVDKGAFIVFTTIFKLEDYSENSKTKKATITLKSEQPYNENWCKRNYEQQFISAYESIKDYKLTVKYVTN